MIRDFEYIKNRVEENSVLIVGGGPDANLLDVYQYQDYDFIVRLNNFKYANDCKRTDIWYSYFGRNIKAMEDRVKEEDIPFIVCKYPVNKEFAWVHEFRKEAWKTMDAVVAIPNEIQSFQTNNPFGISPTCGFSAIFTFLAMNPGKLTIVGFDFFESGVHNLDENWDGSGEHTTQLERKIVEAMVAEEKLEWVKHQ